MAELRIRRAGRADWATIWPVWHEIVAAGDTFAYDPDTSFDEGERMWIGPEPEETWVAGSDDGVLLGTHHLGEPRGRARTSRMPHTWWRRRLVVASRPGDGGALPDRTADLATKDCNSTPYPRRTAARSSCITTSASRLWASFRADSDTRARAWSTC